MESETVVSSRIWMFRNAKVKFDNKHKMMFIFSHDLRNEQWYQFPDIKSYCQRFFWTIISSVGYEEIGFFQHCFTGINWYIILTGSLKMFIKNLKHILFNSAIPLLEIYLCFQKYSWKFSWKIRKKLNVNMRQLKYSAIIQ